MREKLNISERDSQFIENCLGITEQRSDELSQAFMVGNRCKSENCDGKHFDIIASAEKVWNDETLTKEELVYCLLSLGAASMSPKTGINVTAIIESNGGGRRVH
jgi:hypothetical protein